MKVPGPRELIHMIRNSNNACAVPPSLLYKAKACNGPFTVVFRASEESRLGAQAPFSSSGAFRDTFTFFVELPSAASQRGNRKRGYVRSSGSKTAHEIFLELLCKLLWTAFTARLPLSRRQCASSRRF